MSHESVRLIGAGPGRVSAGEVPLSINIFQLLLEDPEAFPNQIQCVVGLQTSETAPERVQRCLWSFGRFTHLKEKRRSEVSGTRTECGLWGGRCGEQRI